MMHDTAAVPFLERLRTETADAHTALERLPVSSAILENTVTDTQYATYLHLMHDVVASVESFVYPQISHIILDLDHRRKAKDIANDLGNMGETVRRTDNPFVVTGNTGFSLGIAYVVEGSTLGGRFLLKNIQSVLGYDETKGASYFGGYGTKTGSMWKSFLSQMTEYVSQNGCEDDVIAGANHAFKAIHEHLAT